MKNVTLAFALLCSVATPAFALIEAKSSATDPSDRTIQYDAHNRVAITIPFGDPAVITFDPSETIEKAVKMQSSPFDFFCDNAPADQKQQCVDGYSSNLPIVGTKVGKGGMVVITRGQPPEDWQRTYVLSVEVSDAATEDKLTRHLTYLNKPEKPTPAQVAQAKPQPDPAAVAAWRAGQRAKEAEVSRARMVADVNYVPPGKKLNADYRWQGTAKNIAPVQVFDNSAKTAFRYPGAMQPPAVFRVLDDTGSMPSVCVGGRATKAELEAPEQAVNARMVNNMLVVDETASHWRLRSGDAVLDAWNCAHNPAAALDPLAATGMVRQIIQR